MKEKEIIKPLPQGTTLHGKSSTYVIERPLGQGSFGTTYLATAKMKGPLGIVDVKVAIKEFFMREVNGRSGSTVTGSTDKGLFENYRKRFRREAENLASLQHPHIIKVLEMFEENNTCYYVMEYIDGGSLDEYIASAGRLPEIEARGYAGQLCEALLYMHQHNMLHLDVKPANIMRRSDGSLVLIDFGLSKQYNEDGEPESSTSIGKGSPGYAPIEQENYNPEDGDKNKKVKAPLPVTIDVYALGASIYKMLVGKRPPDASMILNGGFPRAALEKCSVSEVVIDVVAKAMAPIVKDRYPTMKDLYYAITEGTRPEDDKKDKNPKPEGKNKGMEQQGKYKELTPIDIAKPSGGSVLTRWIKAHLKMTIIVAAALVSIAGVWIGLTQHAKTLYSKAVGYYDKKEYAEVEKSQLNDSNQSATTEDKQHKVGRDFVLIPSGKLIRYQEFYGDSYRDINLDSFYICTHEVTQEEYFEIMGDNPSTIKGDSLPVNCLSFRDALVYCNKRSIKEGYTGFYSIEGSTVRINHDGNGYRLPTKYEWAYASRADDGTRTRYAGGNNLNKIAWYGGNSKRTLHPIATKEPNSRGLYDMNGNVLEFLWEEPFSNCNISVGSSFRLYIAFGESDGIGCSYRNEENGMRVVLVTDSMSSNNNTGSLSAIKIRNPKYASCL